MRITRRRALIGFVLVAAVATVVKWVINEAFDNFKGEVEHHSWSIAEARSKGTLVRELEWTPRMVAVDGKQIPILEAWIEERHLNGHRYVWIPTAHRLSGTNLCVLSYAEDADKWRHECPLAPSVLHTTYSQGKALKVYPIHFKEGEPITLYIRRPFPDESILAELKLHPR
jgi:hypothetical protein